jgi:hypothetical protein
MYLADPCEMGADEAGGSRDQYAESDPGSLAYEGKVLRRSEKW